MAMKITIDISPETEAGLNILAADRNVGRGKAPPETAEEVALALCNDVLSPFAKLPEQRKRAELTNKIQTVDAEKLAAIEAATK